LQLVEAGIDEKVSNDFAIAEGAAKLIALKP
jgi:hypothetical protein